MNEAHASTFANYFIMLEASQETAAEIGRSACRCTCNRFQDASALPSWGTAYAIDASSRLRSSRRVTSSVSFSKETMGQKDGQNVLEEQEGCTLQPCITFFLNWVSPILTPVKSPNFCAPEQELVLWINSKDCSPK